MKILIICDILYFSYGAKKDDILFVTPCLYAKNYKYFMTTLTTFLRIILNIGGCNWKFQEYNSYRIENVTILYQIQKDDFTTFWY